MDILTIALSITSVLFIGVYAAIGAARGLDRSLVRLATLFVAELAALLCAGTLARLLFPSMADALSAFVPQVGEALSTVPAELSGLIYALTGGLTAPVFFVLFFILFSVIMLIIYAIIAFTAFPSGKYRKAGVKEQNGASLRRRHRGFGALCGAISGCLVLAVLYLPVYGYAPFVEEVANSVIEEEVAFEESKSVPHTVTSVLFGDKAFAYLTRVEYENESISLKEESDTITAVLPDIKLLGSAGEEWGETEARAIERICDTLAGSRLLSSAGSVITGSAARSWEAGETWLTIEAPQISGDAKGLWTALLDVFADVQPENVSELVRTAGKAAAVLVESEGKDVLNGNLSMEKLTESGAVGELLGVLMECRTIDPVTVAAANLGIEYLAGVLGISRGELAEREMYAKLSVLETASDTRRAKEGAIIEELLSTAEAMTAEGGISTETVDAVAAGKLLDTLRRSLLFGNASYGVADSLLSLCVDSGFFETAAKDVILEKFKAATVSADGELSFSLEDTVTAAQQAASVLRKLSLAEASADPAEASDDERRKEIGEELAGLAATVTPESAEVLCAMITEEAVAAYVPEGKSVAAAETVRAVLNELAQTDNIDEGQREKEAHAIEQVLGVATGAGNSEVIADGAAASELVGSVMESEIISSALVNATASSTDGSEGLSSAAAGLSAAEKAYIVEAIAGYSANPTPAEAAKLTAVISLIGGQLNCNAAGVPESITVNGQAYPISSDRSVLIAAFGG